MKFAVVEYTSKSGKIWKHQTDKPNYLADPAKEIDPTSFGCYVSALDGEHIPLKGIITGTAAPVSWATILGRRVYRKFLGHWPTTYDISYLLQFDILMVVHQLSDSHEMVSLLQRLRQHSPRPFLIGVPTQPFGLLQNRLEADMAANVDVRAHMDACDVFLTVVDSTLPAWQQKSTTPVVYMPQPYPVAFASQYAKPQSQKKPILFVAGVTDRPNIALGHKVARKIQVKYPQYSIHVTDTPGHTQDLSGLAGGTFATQAFLPWQEQLEYLSQVSLVINTDYTRTRGRVQVDCAAVGTPAIGADSDAQRDLFPDLFADQNTTADELIARAIRLLENKDWYTEVASKARERLAKYTYELSKQRILALVEKYPQRH